MNNLTTRLQAGHIRLLGQLFRFGVIGVLAAAVHFNVVVVLVQAKLFVPLVANIFGFMVGFQMSYWGHRRWTFSDTSVLHSVAVMKLVLVQAVNLAANETLFYIFLKMHIPYQFALIIVLTVLPIFTFLASKWWVFKS